MFPLIKGQRNIFLTNTLRTPLPVTPCEIQCEEVEAFQFEKMEQAIAVFQCRYNGFLPIE